MQIFTGANMDMDGGFGYAYQKEQYYAGPTFLFFLDGMKEEKF